MQLRARRPAGQRVRRRRACRVVGAVDDPIEREADAAAGAAMRVATLFPEATRIRRAVSARSDGATTGGTLDPELSDSVPEVAVSRCSSQCALTGASVRCQPGG